MTDDTFARKLHDRATRGGTLTEAEQSELAAWYVQQDQEEAALLASSPKASSTLDALREEVGQAVARLQTITQQVQAQADENQALRRDIISLSQRLSQTTTSQAA